MSIRTIIEINHDYLRQFENPLTLLKIVHALKSSDPDKRMANGKIPGVRYLGQRHHSETLDLKVE